MPHIMKLAALICLCQSISLALDCLNSPVHHAVARAYINSTENKSQSADLQMMMDKVVYARRSPNNASCFYIVYIRFDNEPHRQLCESVPGGRLGWINQLYAIDFEECQQKFVENIDYDYDFDGISNSLCDLDDHVLGGWVGMYLDISSLNTSAHITELDISENLYWASKNYTQLEKVNSTNWVYDAGTHEHTGEYKYIDEEYNWNATITVKLTSRWPLAHYIFNVVRKNEPRFNIYENKSIAYVYGIDYVRGTSSKSVDPGWGFCEVVIADFMAETSTPTTVKEDKTSDTNGPTRGTQTGPTTEAQTATTHTGPNPQQRATPAASTAASSNLTAILISLLCFFILLIIVSIVVYVGVSKKKRRREALAATNEAPSVNPWTEKDVSQTAKQIPAIKVEPEPDNEKSVSVRHETPEHSDPEPATPGPNQTGQTATQQPLQGPELLGQGQGHPPEGRAPPPPGQALPSVGQTAPQPAPRALTGRDDGTGSHDDIPQITPQEFTH